ncbi:hypothetical protein Patl1_10092 [Pistacia atlantica]|uniref:Uncharacterized protein n=1 Tax=Pistacia atlantica TaxID=434234 RepID=A0ACC1A701_9ROSI|nr:hypothetical protein Patl1_10092 [Pistacia atlantica]
MATGDNFYQDVDLTWGDFRAKILDGGKSLSLTLDKTSGSGFRSKREYLFGRIDMELKLVSGDSAGTVTAYYLSSEGPYHDEIDFEFLGNSSGEPYIVHTNVYTQGKGNREQQFYLWFDPTKKFHTYSIVWNPQRIIFLVDNIPIREYNNEEAIGVPFPTYYRNFNANACVSSLGSNEESLEMDRLLHHFLSDPMFSPLILLTALQLQHNCLIDLSSLILSTNHQML